MRASQNGKAANPLSWLPVREGDLYPKACTAGRKSVLSPVGSTEGILPVMRAIEAAFQAGSIAFELCRKRPFPRSGPPSQEENVPLGGVDSKDSLLGANQIQSCFLGGSLRCDGPVGFERRGAGADGAADIGPDQRGSTGRDNRMFVEGVLWIVRTGSP